MGAEYTFHDYREGGENLIFPWLRGLPVEIRVKFDKWLLHLEGAPPGQWTRPYVDTLTDQCDGLFEIRVDRSRVHYRLLGCPGPGDRTPTLLHGFIKRGKKVPPSECSIALARKEIVYASADENREPHKYG